MEVKQILVAFWWIIAFSVVAVSFYRIDSLKLEREPIDTARDIALIVNELGIMEANANVTYLLDEVISVRLNNGKGELFNNNIKIVDYPYFEKGNVFAESIENGVILIKNG